MVAPGVYAPAEDTFLIADNLDVRAGEEVLEIGTGCGILAISAAKAGAKVVATDSNPAAVACAKENAKLNGVGGKIDFRLGNLFEPVAWKAFDLVIFNPPYLPASGELEGDSIGLACEGGRDGTAVISPFLKSLPRHLRKGGRAIFLLSSFSKSDECLKELSRLGFEFETKKEKLSFEELVLVKARMAE